MKRLDEARRQTPPLEILKVLYDAIGKGSAQTKELDDIMDGSTLPKFSWRKMLKETDFLEKVGGRKGYRISQSGLDLLGFDGENEDDTLNKNKAIDIDKALSKKIKRYKVPASPKNDKFEKFTKNVIKNMRTRAKGISQEMLMLAGDPGSGKTSAIRQIAKLFGMTLITVEGSHASEEDLVNIPYVIARGNNEKTGVDSFKRTSGGSSDFEVVDAKSSLVSQMEEIDIIKDAEYEKMLNSNKLLKKLYNKYKTHIDALRKTNKNKKGFKVILFVDEFYRTGSPKIQNILRTMLNGDIGNTKIPSDAFLIFASNFDNTDGSLDDIPSNHNFTEEEFKMPSADEFMRYIADQYTTYDAENENEDGEPAGDVLLNEQVYNAFSDVIESSDFDKHNDIRVSTRRMEQIMLYINDRLPVSDANAGERILTWLKTQFTDYQTGSVSPLFEKYKTVVESLILETSNVTVKKSKPIYDWKDTLGDMIDAKINIGANRKYPPVLSGMPGTSKTVTVKEIAKERDMGLIVIDASTLSIDSVIGIPVPEITDGEIKTVLTEPPLYKTIMNSYNAQYDSVVEEGRQYNYILFIDELTRTKSLQVFNKIRMLLLESKVNSNYKIPDDILIVGAMNPSDSAKGAVMDLPDHTKDVLDILPVSLSFDAVVNYIDNIGVTYKEESDYLGFNVGKLASTAIQVVATRFKADTDQEGNEITDGNITPFYWNIGNFNIAYISPRQMSMMAQGIIVSLKSEFEFEEWDKLSSDPEAIGAFKEIAKEVVYDKIYAIVKNATRSEQIEEFDVSKFAQALRSTIYNDISYDTIESKKSEAVNSMSLSQIWMATDLSLEKLLENEGNVVILNWLNSIEDTAEITTDFNILLKHALGQGYKVYSDFLSDFLDFIFDVNEEKVKGGVFDSIFYVLRGVFKDYLQLITTDEVDIMDLLSLVRSIKKHQDMLEKYGLMRKKEEA